MVPDDPPDRLYVPDVEAATPAEIVVVAPSVVNDPAAGVLPPTVTLQYHFTPEQKFSPYVGAGLNYSFFYGETKIDK